MTPLYNHEVNKDLSNEVGKIQVVKKWLRENQTQTITKDKGWNEKKDIT